MSSPGFPVKPRFFFLHVEADARTKKPFQLFSQALGIASLTCSGLQSKTSGTAIKAILGRN
jgi:hypothetical protein